MAIPDSCISFHSERMVCLKKFACLLASFCLLSLGTQTVFAKEPAVRVAEDPITLTQTQTAFEAVIEIEPGDAAYAGIEIGVACPDDVTVTACSASCGSMSAGPALANGLYWTSFFESDNTLSGAMKITLQVSCPQNFKSGTVDIREVKILTKDGASVNTEKLTPSVKLTVTRIGESIAGTGSTGTGLVESSDPTADSSEAPQIEDDGTQDIPNGEDVKAPSSGGTTPPNTGEKSVWPLWIILLCASAAGLAKIARFFKKVRQ